MTLASTIEISSRDCNVLWVVHALYHEFEGDIYTVN